MTDDDNLSPIARRMTDQLTIDEAACLCTGRPPCWICAPAEEDAC